MCTDCEERKRNREGSEGTGSLSRRNFLKLGIGALGALAVSEVAIGSYIFLQSQSRGGSYGGVITAGEASEFPLGSVTEFVDGCFFLIRAPEGGFLALHTRCPHLGCTVTWEPEMDKFLCPCHASTFDFYGNFDNPPVPRPLDVFEIEIEDGVVRVDTAQPKRREQFAPDQLTYA